MLNSRKTGSMKKLEGKIKDYLRTDVPSVPTDATLREVAELLEKEDTTAVLVKTDGDIAGIVTDSDVLANISSGRDLDSVKAEEFMTSCEIATKKATTCPCLQLHREDPIQDAVNLMTIAEVHHVLVWDNEGHVIGLVTMKDLLKRVIG